MSKWLTVSPCTAEAVSIVATRKPIVLWAMATATKMKTVLVCSSVAKITV
jgi:hypothetical protein